jgi:hypothetical protein
VRENTTLEDYLTSELLLSPHPAAALDIPLKAVYSLYKFKTVIN